MRINGKNLAYGGTAPAGRRRCRSVNEKTSSSMMGNMGSAFMVFLGDKMIIHEMRIKCKTRENGCRHPGKIRRPCIWRDGRWEDGEGACVLKKKIPMQWQKMQETLTSVLNDIGKVTTFPNSMGGKRGTPLESFVYGSAVFRNGELYGKAAGLMRRLYMKHACNASPAGSAPGISQSAQSLENGGFCGFKGCDRVSC